MSALLYAASFGSVTDTVVSAYVFGLGTFPALLVVSLLGRRLGATGRRWLVRTSGLLLMMFGALTLVRGTPEARSFSVLYLKQPLRWNYLAGFALIVAAVGVIFKKW